MSLAGVFALPAVAVTALSAHSRAPQPSTDELLARTGQYLRQFITRFSNVVAEEDYVQRARSRARRLRSEFHFVIFPGATDWVQFRDVLEVDGKPVGDAERQRVVKLLLEPPADVLRRVREIAEAGSRYNIASIGTANVPTLALFLLQEQHQRQFRFTQQSLEGSVGSSVRVVQFEEVGRPTILRTSAQRDQPARGRFWVDEATGVVLKTELQVGSTRSPAESTTTFEFNETLKIHVPVEMSERHGPLNNPAFTGLATYGRFRRFQVQTDVEIQKP